MVGGMATEMPEQSTSCMNWTNYDYTSIATIGANSFTAPRDNYYRDKCDEEDKEKAQQDRKSAERMRAGWKMNARGHKFHQRKWSMDRPRG